MCAALRFRRTPMENSKSLRADKIALKGAAEHAQCVVRRLVDDAPMIVWEANIDGRCTYLNPESMAGLTSAGEVDLSDWFRFIHPDDFPKAAQVVRQAKKNRAEYWLEYRVVRSDGSVRWIMSTAAPRLAPDGQLQGYVGTLVDVSESHAASARLARSEAEHRLLTQHARDLISHSDADNRYVYVSSSHKDILGYDPQELIGTDLYSYIHPDDLKPPAAVQGRRRATLQNIRFRHKDGHWVWLGASTRAIRDQETGARLGIVSVAREITAQLEAERELLRREERFRSLTSMSSDWYWETDEQIRFTFISEGLRTRLALDPEQLLGTTFESSVENPQDPSFLALLDCVAARLPFSDLMYAVKSDNHPGIVRFLRVSGEPVFDDGAFCGYRGVTHDVTREVRATRALERLATRDALTELPNRAQLDSQLEQRLGERRGGLPQAVFFIDLDGFKEVNDSLGHAAGDTLLKEIALRLTQTVRADDMVARQGGDEFVVVAECRHGSKSAAEIATALCAAIGAPLLVEGYEVRTGSSIGISLFPQDGETSGMLLQNADNALYRAKASGGNTYRFYTPEMGTASKTRLKLHAALRHALERNEFTLHYQPRVNLKTFEMTGMEALLRWTHPELGSISPADFIPLAEETGLIDAIGDWVLQSATKQAQQWLLRYGRPLRISVNLSARQLRNRKLVDSVSDALRASGLPATLLELELTETGLMEDPVLAANVLKQLKEAGIHLAVDDFGTGYSSLSYLCRFPLDIVKLDRSFLLEQRPGQISPRKLAKAIIDLAHSLNLLVVAEGVETRQHMGFLRKTTCDEVQGFCFSRPIPAAEFEALLRDGVDKLPLQYPARQTRPRAKRPKRAKRAVAPSIAQHL
jgi:diguanylate cyclase (GGDEF)-like protein/PAS domain S-box-containing protein